MVHFARVLLRPKCFTFSLGYRLTQWGIFNFFNDLDYRILSNTAPLLNKTPPPQNSCEKKFFMRF